MFDLILHKHTSLAARHMLDQVKRLYVSAYEAAQVHLSYIIGRNNVQDRQTARAKTIKE
jgi:hypothetical protein